MVQLSLQDMWNTFVTLASSSLLPVIALVIMIFVFIAFLTTDKSNVKKTKKTYGIIYAIAIVLVIILNFPSFLGLGNYLMDNFFVALYFPNLIVYLLMLIVTNIMFVKTVLNKKKTDQTKKVLGTLAFCLIHYILFLILNVVGTEEISILNETAIYQNSNLLAMIELSMGIFAVWMLLLLTRYVLAKMANPQVETVEEKEEQSLKTKIEKPVLSRDILEICPPKKMTYRFLEQVEAPRNFLEIDFPKVVYGNQETSKKSREWIEIRCPEVVYDMTPKKEETKEEAPFTLEEYKKMLALLKEIQRREQELDRLKNI